MKYVTVEYLEALGAKGDCSDLAIIREHWPNGIPVAVRFLTTSSCGPGELERGKANYHRVLAEAVCRAIQKHGLPPVPEEQA